MKQKKQHKTQVVGVVALVTFLAATVLAVFGLSQTMVEIDNAAISKTPEAILASAGLSEEQNVFLSVAYYDQKSDECVNLYDLGAREALNSRQFEWSGCGYYNKEVEQGLVEYNLNEKYLPVAVGGKLTPNRGVKDISSWFEAKEGESANYTGSLKLEYQADGAEFWFQQQEFYPLDGVEFSAGDPVNSDGHNHLFTMNFAVPFTVLASGNEGG